MNTSAFFVWWTGRTWGRISPHTPISQSISAWAGESLLFIYNLSTNNWVLRDVLRNLQIVLLQTGYFQGPVQSELTAELRSSLNAFIGSENFEERIDLEAGWIDRPVYVYILERFGARDD